MKIKTLHEETSMIDNISLTALHQAGISEWDDLPKGQAATLPNGRNAKYYYNMDTMVFLLRDPEADIHEDSCVVIFKVMGTRGYKSVYGDTRSSIKLFTNVTDALDGGDAPRTIMRKYGFR